MERERGGGEIGNEKREPPGKLLEPPPLLTNGGGKNRHNLAKIQNIKR